MMTGMECSKCGRDIGNGGLDRCAVIHFIEEGGNIVNARLCVNEPDPCAPKHINATSLAHDISKSETGTPPKIRTYSSPARPRTAVEDDPDNSGPESSPGEVKGSSRKSGTSRPRGAHTARAATGDAPQEL